eukprot:10596-Heterococcus_DN1.PRE.1
MLGLSCTCSPPFTEVTLVAYIDFDSGLFCTPSMLQSRALAYGRQWTVSACVDEAAVPQTFVSQDQSLLETTGVFKWRRLWASSSTFRLESMVSARTFGASLLSMQSFHHSGV